LHPRRSINPGDGTATLPTDWQHLRDLWSTYHTISFFLSPVAPVAFVAPLMESLWQRPATWEVLSPLAGTRLKP
jgi:hypothetical protein